MLLKEIAHFLHFGFVDGGREKLWSHVGREFFLLCLSNAGQKVIDHIKSGHFRSFKVVVFHSTGSFMDESKKVIELTEVVSRYGREKLDNEMLSELSFLGLKSVQETIDKVVSLNCLMNRSFFS